MNMDQYLDPNLIILFRFSENMSKSSYKIENSDNLWNCEIFSIYYFSYLQDYKAALRGGNNLIYYIRNYRKVEGLCTFFIKLFTLRIKWMDIFANVIHCSRLRLWVGYFIYFKLTHLLVYLMFWWMLFIFSSIKGIDMLISKGISNITIEKNWHSQNFDFPSSKNLPPGLFWGAPTLRRYH